MVAGSVMSEGHGHTSMPNVGMRVMISRKRQNVNNRPPIILKAVGPYPKDGSKSVQKDRIVL